MLKAHTRTIHQKDKACEVCGKLFGTKEQLGNVQKTRLICAFMIRYFSYMANNDL